MVAVVLSVLPGYGHLHPMIPLAEALIRCGCTVSFKTSPSFAPIIRDLGYCAQEVGPNWTLSQDIRDTMAAFPRESSKELWSRIFGLRSAAVLAALVEQEGFSSTSPDVLIYDDHDFGAAIYGELLGSFRVCVATTYRSPIESLRMRWLPLWTELRILVGLAADSEMQAFWGDLCLDTLPASFQPNPLASRRGLDEYMRGSGIDRMNLMPGMCNRGHPPEPRIGITFGTVYSQFLPSMQSACDALSDEGFEVSTFGTGSRSRGRSTEVVASRASYLAWLRRQSIVVCHGGRGTLLDCLEFGIPVVCLPTGADQSYNSFRVSSLGAGIDLGQDANGYGDMVKAVLEIARHDLYAANARRLSREISEMASPDDCASHILRSSGRDDRVA